MNRRIHPKPPAPTDEEILYYDNVPLAVAARYIGWTEMALRLALREQRAPFGMSVEGESRYTVNISPGGLVRYKREGGLLIPFEAICEAVKEAMRA